MLGIANYIWRLVPANPILLRVVEQNGFHLTLVRKEEVHFQPALARLTRGRVR